MALASTPDAPFPEPPSASPGIAIHLLTPDGQPIRGALEPIPACSEIGNLHVEEDNSLGFEFLAWQEHWLEDAHPVLRRHPDTQWEGFILVDFEGNEHHEDDLLRCVPGARITGCAHCQVAAPAPAGQKPV